MQNNAPVARWAAWCVSRPSVTTGARAFDSSWVRKTCHETWPAMGRVNPRKSPKKTTEEMEVQDGAPVM